jgi:hypothetical protein
MIVTARQLEELHRDGGKNGRVTLRAGTRLTPLAREWIRKTKVEISYGEVFGSSEKQDQRTGSPRLGRVVWWSDGDHAIAKAALMSFGDSVKLELLNSSRDAVSTVRSLADQVLSHRAQAGVLLVNSAGAATVHANRVPELRAIVGTTVESVHMAMKSIVPNVLIIERSDQSMNEVRNILARFLAGGVA